MNILPGLTGTKRSAIFITLAIVGIVLIVDPFHWITPPPGAPKRHFSGQEIQDISEVLHAEGKAPKDAMAALFVRKNLVIIGSQNFIREEIDFVSDLIPSLPAMGVRMIGLEYLRAADQVDIDRLFSATTFDSTLAQTLMFRRLPLWGYQEYLDLLRRIWEVNSTSLTDKVRVYGLALSQDFTAIHKNADFTDPQVMKGILSQGIPDSFMAAAILKDLSTNPNERMLVLTQRVSSLGNWDDKTYTDKIASFGFANEHRMGVILHKKLGTALATVLFHGPFPAAKSPVRAAFPADGLLDAALDTTEKSPLPTIPSAYELQGSRLGALDSGNNDFNQQSKDRKENSVRLSDLADVYVIFGPIHTLHAISAIPDFITAANLAEALKILPTVRDADTMNPGILNDQIQEQAQDFEKALADFR